MENQLGQQFGVPFLLIFLSILAGTGHGDDRFIEFPGQNVHAPNDQPVAVKVLKILLKDRDAVK